MDILERAFLGTAAVGVVILVVLTSLLAVGPDPVPARALQALNGFDPAAALTGDLARADRR
jgi:hypothetical protein